MDESAGLENRYGGNLIVGSNPTLSATVSHEKGPQAAICGPLFFVQIAKRRPKVLRYVY